MLKLLICISKNYMGNRFLSVTNNTAPGKDVRLNQPFVDQNPNQEGHNEESKNIIL